MKTLFKKSKEWGHILVDLIAYWTPILLVILVFSVSAMMVGNIIGKHIWIVFVSDLVFFYLLWMIFDMNRKRQNNLKKKILVWAIILLFIFIATSTLGVSMITEERVILNIIIFPIGCIVVLTSYVTSRMLK